MIKITIIPIAIILFFTPAFLFGNEEITFHTYGQKYFLPFGHGRSTDLNILKKRITGRYGDYRKSYVPGHMHAGIDLKGDFNEPVYSIGKGTVTHILRDFPHKTIYIRHNDSRGKPFYSAYVHVEDIKIQVGDRVTKDTPIARIFNEEELRASDFGTPPHLHLEIRHNISDNGAASYKSMSVSELNKYCIDPLVFFEKLKQK